QDYEKAYGWYLKAATQGLADAENMVGVCLWDGTGVAQDYERAVEWFRKAAAKDHSYGLANLGKAYFYGEGIDIDYIKAIECFEKALEIDGNNDYARDLLDELRGRDH
ncbi:MAG: tetratricopeptide repeat protein, partial [Caldicoprobacterales bacterium]